MPTNRTRRTRTRNPEKIASWVKRYLTTGEEPEKGTPDYDVFLGWKFFGENIPGLERK